MTWRSKLSLLALAWAGSPALAFEAQAVPFYESYPIQELQGAGGVKIAYKIIPLAGSARAVVIAQGFSETMVKYAELAWELRRAGYSVILYDHRGQGHSGRLNADPHKGYLDDFANLVADLKTVTETAARPLAHDLFLIAHSMGGGVGALYLAQHPDDFRKAILSAPMLAMPLPKWQRTPVLWLMGLCKLLHLDEFYVRGPSDPAKFTFATNLVTSDPERYEELQVKPARAQPQDQVWGITARWLYEAMTGIARARELAGKVQTPVVLLQAGDDRFVGGDGQDDFCAQATRCKILPLPGARHEIFSEQDRYRAPALAATLKFFAEP